jgi:hypothetical protein
MVQTGTFEPWSVLEKRKKGAISSVAFKQPIPLDAPRDDQKTAPD